MARRGNAALLDKADAFVAALYEGRPSATSDGGPREALAPHLAIGCPTAVPIARLPWPDGGVTLLLSVLAGDRLLDITAATSRTKVAAEAAPQDPRTPTSPRARGE
jgi:hypothetical protein